MSRTLLLLGVIGFILALGLVLRLAATPPASPVRAEQEALSVEVITARTQPMPVLLQAAGQVMSQHTVQIRPQVSGMLKELFFREGQSVSKNQRLFQIEPAPFEAALASARAASENAKGTADRLETIANKGYVTQQEHLHLSRCSSEPRKSQIELGGATCRPGLPAISKGRCRNLGKGRQ